MVLNPVTPEAGDVGEGCAMKVSFRQSGGYAGLLRGCELDTAAMESAEAHKLKQLVNNSRVLDMAPKGADAPKKPDLMSYRITIAMD